MYLNQTFTGLGTIFYSSCHFDFKFNSVSTLFHRAYTLSSTWFGFHQEISFLRNYFLENCYPSKLFFKQLCNFLNSKFVPVFNVPNVPKLAFYFSIPFIHDKSFYFQLNDLIQRHLPAVNSKAIPRNPLTIGSFFKYKDKLSSLMTSNVIYLYTCPKCKLGKYVGASRRLLKVRIDCHRGVSYRTGARLTSPEFSNIREHSKKCKQDIEYKHFKILSRAPLLIN